MINTAPAPALTAAEALAYLAPRPRARYTAARITAAAKALGLPYFRLDDAGHYGWNVWNGKGYPCPFATLAEVAQDLAFDHAPRFSEAVLADAMAALAEVSVEADPLAAARVTLPGETVPPAAPAPAPAAAPLLPGKAVPDSITFDQGYKTAIWGCLRTAPAAPAPVVAPGPLARRSAPARLPVDVVALLQRFNLSLEGLLTVGASNAKLAKGAALAWPVILHHLPARSLAAALLGPEAGTTAPRSRLLGLADLAKATGTLTLGMAHNGCPWASKGCADGCLAWSGHGGMGTVPAAARARRTLAYLADSPAYARAILWAIAKAYRQAQAKGLPLAVRLRGTDDLAWHLQRVTVSPAEAVSLARRYGLPVAPGQGQTLAEALSLAPAGSVHLYEYSKAPIDGPLGLQAQRSAGWDVTASLAADRPDGALAAIRAVEAGFRLAVPVALPKGAALPAVLIIERGPLAVDLACIPGDDTDHRWADPSGPHLGCDGVAVILRTKVSRGRGPAAEGFSLQPVMDAWQPLAGGGRAMLRSRPWGQG